MPETSGVSAVEERKRALIARSDLHREIIAYESAQIGAQAQAASAVIARNRWWLLGGAAVAAGVVAVRRPKALLQALPTVLAAWRSFRARRDGTSSEPAA